VEKRGNPHPSKTPPHQRGNPRLSHTVTGANISSARTRGSEEKRGNPHPSKAPPHQRGLPAPVFPHCHRCNVSNVRMQGLEEKRGNPQPSKTPPHQRGLPAPVFPRCHRRYVSNARMQGLVESAVATHDRPKPPRINGDCLPPSFHVVLDAHFLLNKIHRSLYQQHRKYIQYSALNAKVQVV